MYPPITESVISAYCPHAASGQRDSTRWSDDLVQILPDMKRRHGGYDSDCAQKRLNIA